MTEPEEIDEDLFADLYDADESSAKPEPIANDSEPVAPALAEALNTAEHDSGGDKAMPDAAEAHQQGSFEAPLVEQDVIDDSGHGWQHTDGEINNDHMDSPGAGDSHTIGIKEDGKMFIGGLNWETTDQSLKDYFSKFGEVQDVTVMRDGATGRSRGFGFLTFRDPKTVNIVMVKEHHLDGKIIDPKRAIPRDEQERTSKIFVGGVSQEATETDFREYFMQYGRVIDATLMMDKDTGRPRGFGFVTFDSEAAVDATLRGDLVILGKPIEVKKAQPRGNMKEEEERDRRGGRRGGKDDRFRDDNGANQNQNQQNAQGYTNGMTPQVMAQYFARMQQYFAQMMAASQPGNMANAMGMGHMNPAMIQQMQQMQQMQAMQQQMQNQQQGSQSPHAQSQGAQMQGMNAAMLQQMQQMQQMHMQQQSQGTKQIGGVPTGPAGSGGFGGGAAIGNDQSRAGPGYNAQEQLMFEQQKYEQQQARRHDMQYQQQGATSWEGMYDDVPQPNVGGQPGGGRGFSRGGGNKNHQQQKLQQPSAAPANAPTGPKNAGVPGANYRGGGRGGGNRGGFHPYRR